MNYLLFRGNVFESLKVYLSNLIMITDLSSCRFYMNTYIFECSISGHFYLRNILAMRVLVYGAQSSTAESQKTRLLTGPEYLISD